MTSTAHNLRIEPTEVNPPIVGTHAVREGRIELTLAIGRESVLLDATEPLDRVTLRAVIAYLTEGLHAGTEIHEGLHRVHPPVAMPAERGA